MSRKYKFGDSSKLYFISFAVINWIDLFIRKEYKYCIGELAVLSTRKRFGDLWMVYDEQSYTHDHWQQRQTA